MNIKIDTLSEVCNTLGSEDRTPGVDGKGDTARQKRKRMKEKRLRQRQALKEKKREARKQQHFRTPRQGLNVKPPAPFHEMKSDRVQIQFRIGSAIVDKIDRAAASEKRKDSDKGVSRNNWLISAIQEFLENPKPGKYDAVEVTANRVPILFRVGSRIREEIDKTVVEMKIDNRTTWILAAILSKLENYDFS